MPSILNLFDTNYDAPINVKPGGGGVITVSFPG